MIITIDGPAGTGKTTVAREVAERLDFLYFDTGAMYRAVTYRLIKEKVDLSDKQALQNFLTRFQFTIRKIEGKTHYFADGEDVTEIIRQQDVTGKVSAISAEPLIREALVAVQRKLGEGGDAVFEGRDMGTTVFPKAPLKFFLTARPAVRAERRYLEIKDKLQEADQDEILNELLQRDRYDSSRETSPLKQASDAHLIDTSDLTIDQVVRRIIALVPQSK